jgi:hypothetical protein
MPYQINPDNPKCVQVQRDGAWVDLKCHDTAAAAESHRIALTLNVSLAEKTAPKVETVEQPETPTALKSVALLDDPADAAANEDDLYQRIYKTVFEQTGDPLKAQLAALGMVKRSRLRLATKSVGGKLYIGGWSNMFGSPEVRDRVDTYFAPDTEFELDYYHHAPLWYEHGEDAAYGTRPIGRRVLAQRFDYGIWMVHELHTDHFLIDRTIAEIERGELTYSTDSIQHMVEEGFRPRDRKMGYWPEAGCSVVKREAEPGLGGVTFVEYESEAA